jgi:hypothetical protein
MHYASQSPTITIAKTGLKSRGVKEREPGPGSPLVRSDGTVFVA